jgi:uncharacterized membrane protein YgcG
VSAVRQTIDAFRDRQIGPTIGGPGATLRGQWVAVALSLLAVFACFFALGRLTKSGAPSVGGASATPEGSSRAAIPDELSGSSPVAGSVPVAVVVKPRSREPTRARAARPLPIEATGASDAAATPPRAAATPQRVPAVGSEPASTTTPTTPSAPSSGSSGIGSSPAPGTGGGSGSPGGSSGGAGSSGSSAASSGSGSFDTSE